MQSNSSFDTLFRLDGARVLVTGASRGIGRAIAVALARSGADVALAARTEYALRETVRDVQAEGRKAFALGGDLSRPECADSLIDRAVDALGGLDILVHNAGTLPAHPDGTVRLVPLAESTEMDWDELLDVHLRATVALCRKAYPHLSRSRRASVLLMSSVAGLIGVPSMESYAATKAALLSLMRSLSNAWAADSIRVNAICPGWVRTDMNAFVRDDEPTETWLLSHVPLARWAEPEEIAGAAVFLSAPAASFVTGHALIVDGGLSVPDAGMAGPRAVKGRSW